MEIGTLTLRKYFPEDSDDWAKIGKNERLDLNDGLLKFCHIYHKLPGVCVGCSRLLGLCTKSVS